MSENRSSLAQRLIDMGYPALFKAAGHEQRLDAVWQSAPPQDFERLVGDAQAPALSRFLSSQILISKDLTFFSRADLSALSEVYIPALLGNYTAAMSDWGFLLGNDDLGVVGSVFLVLGEQAVPQLIRLLDDATVVDYERPFPDISGLDRTRLQKVRVKDFAALYLSAIKNIPLQFRIPFDERDQEISKLKNQLPSE